MSDRLNLSIVGFERLHVAADGRGEFAGRARKDDLRKLLCDHSKVLAILADKGINISDYDLDDGVRHFRNEIKRMKQNA